VAYTVTGWRKRDQRVAFGFDGGVEVIVGDLGDDLVTLAIPRQDGAGEAETGGETGQEFDGHKSLPFLMHCGSGRNCLVSL
jgi:hypothetical protein